MWCCFGKHPTWDGYEELENPPTLPQDIPNTQIKTANYSLKEFLAKLKASRDSPGPEEKRFYDNFERQRFALIKQLAQQLARIHARGWLHGKFTSENVLVSNPTVDAQLAIRITGFEHAIKMGPNQREWGYFLRMDHLSFLSRSIIGINMLAPETILYGNYFIQSDIFNFGILLWEIFTLEDAVSTVVKNTQWHDEKRVSAQDTLKIYEDHVLANNFKNLLSLDPSAKQRFYGPRWAPHIPRRAQDLMIACWHNDRFQRPTTTVILEQLSRVR